MNQTWGTNNAKKRALGFFLIVLALLIATTIMAAGTLTDWGKVRVTKLKIAGDDGVMYSTYAFIPKTATNESPAPAVINNHGNSSNAIVMLPYAIEQSRRGYVALVVDSAGRGSSELSNQKFENSIDIWINYLKISPIVDSNHLNITGFSMSGGPAVQLALKHIDNFDSVISFSSNGGPGIEATTPINFLIVRGSEDDLVQFDENGVLKEKFDFAKANQIDNFEQNKIYGDFSNKSARMYYSVPGMMHLGGSFYKDSVGAMLDFLQKASPAPNHMPATDIAYLLNNYLGLLGMVMIVALILALVNLLTATAPFSSIKQNLPQNIGLSKVGFAISALIALVLPVALYVKLTGKQDIWFPVSNTFKFQLPNGILTWLTGLVLVSLFMGLLYHFTEGKKKGGSLENYGFTSSGKDVLDWKLIGKSFSLAVIIIAIVIYWINTINAFLGLEYSFWTISFPSLTAHRVLDAIPYMIPFFIVFIISGFGMNIERRLHESGNERKDMIIAALVNMVLSSAGILTIVIVNLVSAANSPINKQAIGGGLYSLVAWGMVFNMLFASIITVYCFRKTGTLWLGAFINSIFVPIILTSSSNYGIAVGSKIPLAPPSRPGAAPAPVVEGIKNLTPIIGGLIIMLAIIALVYFSIKKTKKENNTMAYE